FSRAGRADISSTPPCFRCLASVGRYCEFIWHGPGGCGLRRAARACLVHLPLPWPVSPAAEALFRSRLGEGLGGSKHLTRQPNPMKVLAARWSRASPPWL